MSKNSAKKSSAAKSKKVNSFKVSPLIIVIAFLEVIVLIGAVTFAWFKLTENNRISSGTITVAPDSGLEIDFANTGDDFINLKNYLHDFQFEPATSVDGRNIYFPTTGTFGETSTNDIKFREGTVNDVNSKYISVDFTLTNKPEDGVSEAKVYLDNKSSFSITSSDGNTTGRALRIAFYENDNKSGKAASSKLVENSQGTKCTVYFNDNLDWMKDGKMPRIYIWRNSDNKYYKTDTADGEWPGFEMTHISGDQYYFSFDNSGGYDRVIFSNGGTKDGDKTQTVDCTLVSGHIYTPTGDTVTVSNKEKYSVDYTSNTYESRPDGHVYADLVSDSGYPVIAPGVSTGFRRPYAPVVEINADTGKPKKIVPAYASSIDEYFTAESGTLFTIPANKTRYLTMIIWLEGTDENCTEGYYAGDEINIDLHFATQYGDSVSWDDNYTVHFMDRTKENWLKNEITNKYGITFEPVIQLYDVTDGRGYMMTGIEIDETDDVGNKKKIDWYAHVPRAVINAEHQIEFRRVNPTDESEIWNYWDAKGVSVLSVQNVDGVKTTDPSTGEISYYFTAFADGAPPRSYAKSYTGAPEHSCGGLWGNIEVERLLYVDQTHDKSMQKDSGIMTLCYTYHYNASVSQKIEYKASPEDGFFYYFMVPKSIMENSGSYDVNKAGSNPSYVFNKYSNFNSAYAMNIQTADRNPNVKYEYGYTIDSVMYGKYAMTHNTGYDKSYFGTDIQYIRVKCNDPDLFSVANSSEKATFQAYYWGGIYSTEVNLRNSSGSYALNNWVTYPCVLPKNTNMFLVYRKKNFYNEWNKTEDAHFYSSYNITELQYYSDKKYDNNSKAYIWRVDVATDSRYP